MPDATHIVKAELTAEDKTAAAFRSFGENITKTKGIAEGMVNLFKQLGTAVAELYSTAKVVGFFKEIEQYAAEDEVATLRLNGAFKTLGSSLTNSSPQISNFEKYMESLGQRVSDTQDSLTKLIRVTGDVGTSLMLSKLASDLTASGILDLQSNTDALSNLMNGRARQAAAAYGFTLKDTATVADALALIQTKVNTNLETFATTTQGKVRIMETSWAEFKGFLGTALLPIVSALTDQLYKFMGGMEESTMTAQLWGNEIMRNAAKVGSFLQSINPFSEHFGLEKFKKDLADINLGIDTTEQEIIDKFNKGSDVNTDIKATNNNFGEIGNTLDTLADRIKQSFRDISKAIVSNFGEQTKAISELKKTMAELDDQLDKDLAKSEDKYKADVENMAKKAKTRIDEIDKQIADEQASGNIGYRTRIEQLQEEKNKEQSIIDRAGGIVSNLKEELLKDDFQNLKEAHDKEIAEIKNQAELKRIETQKEELTREVYLYGTAKAVSAPGFYEKATKEGTSFLGAIGAGGTQQLITFNFNGDVSDIDALQKKVIDALNRIATLKGVAGK